MFQSREQSILVIFAGMTEFTNKDTGEIIEMTEIIYGIPFEKNDNACGYGVMKCYKKGNFVKDFSVYTGRLVKASISEKPEGNSSRVKYVIEKINDKEL